MKRIAPFLATSITVAQAADTALNRLGSTVLSLQAHSADRPYECSMTSFYWPETSPPSPVHGQMPDRTSGGYTGMGTS